MAPLFSYEHDEILVEEVANNPSLWLLSHASYKEQRVKDNAWAEIANKVGKPIDQCKKRWRNIKDTYDRKKHRKTGSGATATKTGRKWALEKKLSFLRTAEQQHRGSFSNLNSSEEEEVDSPLSDDEQISRTQTSTPTSTKTPILSPCYTLPQYHTTTRTGKIPNNREKIADNLEKRDVERNEILRALLVEEREDDVDLRGYFSNLNPSEEEEVDSPLPGDEQISRTQNSTPTSTQTPILSPCNILPQYPTTTRRGKRRNNREKIAHNLEKRDVERNEILRSLLVEERDDDVDLFFKSLAKSVKKLTPALQQRAKIETLNVITRLESEMWKPTYGSFFNLPNSPHVFGEGSVTVSPQFSSYSDAEKEIPHQSSTRADLNPLSQPPVAVYITEENGNM